MLNLSGNPIGKDGLKRLCDALSTSTSLQKLELLHCSLTFNEENEYLLSQLLRTNRFLICLDLSGNTVTNCHHIAAGLLRNKTLRILKFKYCFLTDQIRLMKKGEGMDCLRLECLVSVHL